MKLFKTMPMATLFVAVLSISGIYQARANTADDLNANYNKIVDNCGTENRPAFLCSGNLIRFTSVSKKYHTWDPSPNAVKVGGVSFMYIRKDTSTKLIFQDKTAGLIYYPSMLKPSWKGRAEVECSFPTDGWTSYRSDGGCGDIVEYPSVSRSCQDQGIYTADEWYKHYTSIPAVDQNRRLHQCGFKMSIGTPNTSSAFNEALKAQNMAYEASNLLYNYNEIIIKTWPVNDSGQIANPEYLPIQAFFYTIQGANSGLDAAQYFQQDYYHVTGIWIPIVKVNADNPNNIIFSYSSTDQVIAGCSK